MQISPYIVQTKKEELKKRRLGMLKFSYFNLKR
jgi:hypothetical protein